jgi:hypothetical protein
LVASRLRCVRGALDNQRHLPHAFNLKKAGSARPRPSPVSKHFQYLLTAAA